MRKIEQVLKKAWDNATTVHISNSAVKSYNDGRLVYLELFGNRIAERVDGRVKWTLAGWNTATTRSRLHSILGIPVSQKRGIPVLDGRPISASAWYDLNGQ